MLLDARIEYVIVSDDWFKHTGKFHCLASRHGNAIIELYSGTAPQLWRVSRSGRIRNCGDEVTFLNYDRERHVRVFTSTNDSTTWWIESSGKTNSGTRFTPRGADDVKLRCAYPSRFVECEEPGFEESPTNWFLIEADRIRTSVKR